MVGTWRTLFLYRKETIGFNQEGGAVLSLSIRAMSQPRTSCIVGLISRGEQSCGSGSSREFFKIITEKCQEIYNKSNFIQFIQAKLHQFHYAFSITVLKTGSGSAFKKQLDLDPHWEKQLYPDPQNLNADPQPWASPDPPASGQKGGGCIK